MVVYSYWDIQGKVCPPIGTNKPLRGCTTQDTPPPTGTKNPLAAVWAQCKAVEEPAREGRNQYMSEKFG